MHISLQSYFLFKMARETEDGKHKESCWGGEHVNMWLRRWRQSEEKKIHFFSALSPRRFFFLYFRWKYENIFYLWIRWKKFNNVKFGEFAYYANCEWTNICEMFENIINLRLLLRCFFFSLLHAHENFSKWKGSAIVWVEKSRVYLKQSNSDVKKMVKSHYNYTWKFLIKKTGKNSQILSLCSSINIFLLLLMLKQQNLE